eukprot:CAMPEP_0119046188 /NCGR_PEP_ID=MMETSP1177-20130426/44960_1 /TAXON_ID=2985 /ORGANISM="Ochromonas sp, Strain CCMP1899" /LENGTH=79 /DNA_ID=CAMNT_0007018987 /DNA_START=17 /DNA_END=253 /DNA_ORIENTATION=-
MPDEDICYFNHKSDTGEGTDIHVDTDIHVHQTAPWSYQADYYGVCTCIHQMLYLQPLTTMTGTAIEAHRRGFHLELTSD